MIRPITVATFLMACGSGLYLYQEKHEVQLLDRTIEKTVHETAGLREQSRVLAAEWTMLNDPERLRQYSDKYLVMKSIAPPQFTSLASLDSRLPPVAPETPPQGNPPRKPRPWAINRSRRPMAQRSRTGMRTTRRSPRPTCRHGRRCRKRRRPSRPQPRSCAGGRRVRDPPGHSAARGGPGRTVSGPCAGRVQAG